MWWKWCLQETSSYKPDDVWHKVGANGVVVLSTRKATGPFPGGTVVKNPPAFQKWRCEFNPWVRKIPSRMQWQPTSIFLPGDLHGQRSLLGYSPWGCKESDTTEQLSMHTWAKEQQMSRWIVTLCDKLPWELAQPKRVVLVTSCLRIPVYLVNWPPDALL